MDDSKRKTEAGRSWLAPTCASGAVLVLLLGSCLNPRPEELPSDQGPDEVVLPDNGGPVRANDGTTPDSAVEMQGEVDEGSPDSAPSAPGFTGEEGVGSGAADAGVDGGPVSDAPLVDGEP